MLAVPAASRVTIPLPETVAIVVSDDPQLILAESTVWPFWLRTVAERASDWPGIPAIEVGVTEMALTAGEVGPVELCSESAGDVSGLPSTHAHAKSARTETVNDERIVPPAVCSAARLA
jgi:hypothetical protein